MKKLALLASLCTAIGFSSVAFADTSLSDFKSEQALNMIQQLAGQSNCKNDSGYKQCVATQCSYDSGYAYAGCVAGCAKQYC